MLPTSCFTKTVAIYTSDVHQSIFGTYACQLFGKTVLHLNETSLIRHFAENTKSLRGNLTLKGALYFYIFMARKAFFNHILNYSFKITMTSFNSLARLYVNLLAEHKSVFTSIKFQMCKYIQPQKVFFLRVGTFLTGAVLLQANELFQNIYKDIRPKSFCIAAKFSKVLLLS